MKAEFTIDLVFIRYNITEQNFTDSVEEELKTLFAEIGKWTIKARQDGQLDILTAEINGIWSWESEAEIIAYLEHNASAQFWEWLQGFQVKHEVKEEVEQSFCHLKSRVACERKGDGLHGLGA